MKFIDGITDEALAHEINAEAYDAECDAMNCPTPKADRQTPGAFSVHKHPDREEWRLFARSERQRAIDYIRASHKTGWKDSTDVTEDDWRPLLMRRSNGDLVQLKRVLNEPAKFQSKVLRLLDNALDEIIAERA